MFTWWFSWSFFLHFINLQKNNCDLHDLGSGKTTLIKNFCNYLNVLDNVSSPTFPVINEYLDNKGNKIFHFDFYRINTIQTLDIGTDLFLDSGYYCFIEWPKLILPC